jgi:hypothetical protein
VRDLSSSFPVDMQTKYNIVKMTDQRCTDAATNLSATYSSVLFGHIFCMFRPHILCFSDIYDISACFGHVFRAFRPHILLLAAGGLKTDIFKTVVKVFRDQGFQVL